eukprot:1279869-Ditylum_brightwellii.AAC.1
MKEALNDRPAGIISQYFLQKELKTDITLSQISFKVSLHLLYRDDMVFESQENNFRRSSAAVS